MSGAATRPCPKPVSATTGGKSPIATLNGDGRKPGAKKKRAAKIGTVEHALTTEAVRLVATTGIAMTGATIAMRASAFTTASVP